MIAMTMKSGNMKTFADAFIKAGSGLKGFGAGLGALAAAHPIITALAGLAAVAGIASYVSKSGERANEKMEASVAAYKESTDEVQNLNSELKTTSERIDELSAKKGLTILEKGELENLREAKEYLETYERIARSEQEKNARQSANDAVTAYNKNFKSEISEEQTQKDIAEINSYTNRQEDNDLVDALINSGKNNISMMFAGIEYYKALRDQLSEDEPNYRALYDEYSQKILDAKADINAAEKDLISYKDAIELVPEDARTEAQNEVLTGIKQTIDYIDKTIDPVSYKAKQFEEIFSSDDLYDARAELIKFAKEANKPIDKDSILAAIPNIEEILAEKGFTVDDLVNDINSRIGNSTSGQGSAIQDQKISLDSYKQSVDSAVAAQSNLVSAFSSSRSAAGMNAEEINNVTTAFKDLERFDYNRLFETTANGVGMNAAVFAEYNAQLQKEVKSDFLGKIAKKQQELNKAIRDGDTEGHINSLQKEIQTFELLANQYDGITSKYNNFVNATSSANSRDSFEGIAKGYDGIKSLIKQGWVSSDDVTSYLDLMLGGDWRNDFADAKEAFSSLSKETNAAGHSLKDYMTLDKDGNLTSSGVWQFIKDMPTVMQSLDYAWKDADGKWNLDLTGEKLQNVVEAYGTTAEYVELITKALGDAGMDVKFNSDLGGIVQEATTPAEVSTEDLPPVDVDANLVATGIDVSQVDPPDITANLNVGAINGIPSNITIPATIVGTYSGTGGGHSSSSGKFASGTMLSIAHADGTAYNVLNYKRLSPSYAGGRVSLPRDEYALTNEVGQESIIRNGEWFMLPPGPHMEHLKKGDIIFSAEQTKDLLNFGKTNRYAKSYATGTVDKKKLDQLLRKNGINPNSISNNKSYIEATGYDPNGNGGSSSGSGGDSGGGGGGGNDSSSSKSSELQKVDWIEVAIDRINRAVKKLTNAASNAFSTLAKRSSATSGAISKINEEIQKQTAAEKRYMQEANSVQLSDNLKKLVQDGTVDINEYDADTKKLIDEYKTYYEKALSAGEAVTELHGEIAQLYRDAFDMAQKDADNKIALIEQTAREYETRIDLVEASGYLSSANVYNSLISNEQKKIVQLKQEYTDLQNAMNRAMSSGEIEKDSEAYYDMLLTIGDIKDEINQANIELVKYSKTVRDIKWEYFDYAQDRISAVSDEAEFLVDLLSNKKLFDDSGLMNENGLATVGLYAQKYNTYMAQADAYAKEVKSINGELARDPNDTALIKRREDLLSLQQKSILAAEKEKAAMVNLTEDGVKAQLDAMKELIDSYNKSLDSAKDLYDYQKNIAKQTKKIGEIEKQIAAYEGNDSEESRSRLQKLRTQLADERENLNQTEYDKYVSDQKSLLDDMYNDYEKTLNDRLDNVDGLISEMIDTVNDKSNIISDALISAASDVGYTMSGELRNLWTEEIGVVLENVSLYNKDFSEKINGTNQILSGIYSMISNMVSASNQITSVDRFATGGVVRYTGLAHLDGTKSRPELVLNQNDSKNFLELRDILRGVDISNYIGNNPVGLTGIQVASIGNITGHSATGGLNIDNMEITIPIDHVENYDDFVEHMRNDKQLERMIQSMTTNIVSGGSTLDKYKYKWK